MTDLQPAPGLDPVALDAVARIVIGHDGEDHVLGRPDLGIFIAVPEPGVDFVRTLQDGGSLGEATARASESAGEAVDGLDFLESLGEAGLLDGPTRLEGSQVRGREIRWIHGVSPRVASYVAGPVAWPVYVLSTLFVLGVLAWVPDLRPRFEQIWWLPDPVASALLIIPLSLTLISLHEAWHWLAGRALDVPATFRVSHRGIFLVFETDLSQIVTVPRRRRYFAFLAGMAFDVTVLAICLALRLADRGLLLPLPGWLSRLLAAVALGQLFRIVWQFFGVAFRSDMYAVLANALRCHDLYRATWLTTRDRLTSLDDAQRAELEAMSDRDRRVAGWFGAVYLSGIVTMLWFTVTFGIPGMIGLLSWMAVNLTHPQPLTWAFWSSTIVAAFVVAKWVLPPVLAVRERRLRRAGALR